MRLTDTTKYKLIAEYVDGVSKAELAKKYGVGWRTVDRIVNDPENREMAEKCKQKKAEAAEDIFDYMDRNKGKVTTIMGKYLEALCDDEKIELSTVSQLTTALGTLIDKWTMARNNGTGGEVRLAYIAEQDEPEQPPAEIEDEDEADE